LRNFIYTLILLAILSNLSFSQNITESNKKLIATKISTKIKLDAKLDEPEWQKADVAKDFTNLEPLPGEKPSQTTEIKVLYDNEAIYIGAFMSDSHPDSILNELSQRDKLGNTDWFGVIIDAYQDGINGVEFIVTPAGIQFDAKFSGIPSGLNDYTEDVSWDAVWSSVTRIADNGWYCELKIPYSALRFKTQKIQNWNINFFRNIRRSREKSSWNTIMPNIRGIINQSGTLQNLENIQSATRLQFNPFIAAYTNHYKDASTSNIWNTNINAGMDIKYGINDAFTLDMTLIPDFGQVQFDNRVVNLTPYEVRFQENRPFFTEGTELFNKGNLFYSRRIGSAPINYGFAYENLKSNEIISKNPTTTPVLNATKISGRGNKGLGVGLFNAITGSTYATIENLDDHIQRKVQTSPLVNYNLIVLDKNLKYNSSITFVNSNVFRDGATRDANVSGLLFTLRNKSNEYAISGNSALSQRYDNVKNDIGYQYSMNFQKTNGNWQWYAFYNEESYNYNPNDLGYLYSPNERTVKGSITYLDFKPKRRNIRWNVNLTANYTRLQKPDAYNTLNFNASYFAMTKKFFAYSFIGYIEPIGTNDYFEPRTLDFSRYYFLPRNYRIGGWGSSDYRKKVAIDFDFYYRQFDQKARETYSYSVSPRWRINDHFSFIYDINFINAFNDEGRTFPPANSSIDKNKIIFGKRNVNTYEQLLTAKYTFNSKMNLSLVGRYYWTKVIYKSIFELNQDGSLIFLNSSESNLYSGVFNFFNIDLIYTWRFAPGSDIIVAYKNSISGSKDYQLKYFETIKNLNTLPQNNNFSIKVIYFIDYQKIRNSFKR